MESLEPFFEGALSLALKGQWREVSELLETSTDLAAFGDGHGQTLLHIVAGMDGSASVIRALIDLGADVNRQDDSGAIPIGNAIHGGGHRHGLDADANVELLIDAGASLSQFDETGNPPLDAALYERRPNLVRLLMAAEADPFQVNAYGDDAYAHADWLKEPHMKLLLAAKSGQR